MNNEKITPKTEAEKQTAHLAGIRKQIGCLTWLIVIIPLAAWFCYRVYIDAMAFEWPGP